jgi:NAD(P)-dependent dehydrogenase (short-subunit alcohol dehydrogenase family)
VSGTVVVGGGSGIGRACAELLAERGRQVAVLDLRAPETAPAGAEAVIEVDVRDPDAVEQALGEAEERIGPLTGAVHAAGTARVTPLLEIEPKEWKLVLDVNLTGAWNVLSAVARQFSARGGGAFVAVSSIDGARPGSRPRALLRVQGRARVARPRGSTRARPLGVRVNAVAPGVVATPLMDRCWSGPTCGTTSSSTFRSDGSRTRSRSHPPSPFCSRTTPATSPVTRSSPTAG